MKKRKTVLTVQLEEETKRRIRQLGVELDCNLSRAVRILLDRGLKTFEKTSVE